MANNFGADPSSFEIDPDKLREEVEPTAGAVPNGHDKVPFREFPVMAAAAFYVVPGDIVRTIEPHTESDPTTLMVTLLVYLGSLIGRGPYYQVEGTRHHPNLNALIVGETGKSRKGTGDGRVREIFDVADKD